MVEQSIDKLMQSAIGHHQAGRLADAESAYRRVLVRQPNHFNAVYLLGVLAHQAGNSAAAADLIRQAISLNPGYAEAHAKLGVALASLGQFEPAVEAFEQAIALNPAFAEAHTNLGASLAALSRFDQAVGAYRRAIAIRPNYPEALSNLGVSLEQLEKFDEAVATYRQAIKLQPGLAEIYSNLGSALTKQGLTEEAIAVFDEAIAFNPSYAEAYANLGRVLNDIGQFDQAAAASKKAIDLRPDFANAHWNLALTLLSKGDLANGFREYEWRFRHKDNAEKVRSVPVPQWRGEELRGRTIVLRSEQGFGDVIQFVRYAPLVAARGAKVILESNPELYRLLRCVPGMQQVVEHGQPLPPCDLQCPMLSLPAAFSTAEHSIPREVPYLSPDAALVDRWEDAFADSSGKLKVGLIWSGNPKHTNDRNRSMRLMELLPLADVPGVQFYSLQKGPAAAQRAVMDGRWSITDYTDRLADFADTAAMLSHLDLVITVDTAVAHLAGAMGKPVWVMLPFVAEWRWMVGREDSPWYPTMRLFRQSALGRWENVVERVAGELGRLSRTK
jgi:tetratricopeptide (TPR) repeat protein